MTSPVTNINTSSTGLSGVPGSSPSTPSRVDSIKRGVGSAGSAIYSAAANASEWRPVKSVRNSTVWSVITWPFSAIGSLFSGIWSRISKALGKAPIPIPKEQVTIEFPGWFWTSSVTTSPERAIRKGWLPIEKGVENKDFTLEQAQINGWVPVTFKGYMWNTTMMLKTAIETGKMTVEEAIAAGHITAAQAAKADWIQKN